jgi:type IV pilus assembly protein PilE
MKKESGFTLMELMIAVALVALLTAFALPAYQQYAQRAARADAQATLVAAAGAMERYKSQRFTYSGATEGSASTDTVPDQSPTTGTAKYSIDVTPTVDGTGYILTAVSTGAFISNGKKEAMTVDEKGNHCLRPLATGVSTCDFTDASDTRW